MRICGIYRIVNQITKDYYLGGSVNISSRLSVHKSLLSKNKHPNIHLQRAWNKYGGDNFSFEFFALCRKEILKDREQFFIDLLKPSYNLSKLATGASGVTTDRMRESARKVGLSQKGKNKPESYSEKLSIRMVGNKINLGKKRSDETKAKQSKALIGNKRWLGKHHSETTKEKIRQARLSYLTKVRGLEGSI